MEVVVVIDEGSGTVEDLKLFDRHDDPQIEEFMKEFDKKNMHVNRFSVDVTEFNYSKYPYRYKDKYCTLYDAKDMLAADGYPVADMDELEFSQYIYDRQRDEVYDGDEPIPRIDGLEERFYLSYRGGEKDTVTYAENEGAALDKVVGWNDHYDLWEVEEM